VCNGTANASFTRWFYTVKLVFLTTAIVAIVATVAEIEGASTFREICLEKFHETEHVTRCNAC